MKRPSKPRKPSKPNAPKEFSNKTILYGYYYFRRPIPIKELFQRMEDFAQGESFRKFLVREKHLEPDEPLKLENIHVLLERCDIFYKKSVRDENYNKKYEKYLERLEAYNKKLTLFEEKMRRYKINLEIYQAWKIKKQEDKLQNKIKKLEKDLKQIISEKEALLSSEE